MTHVEPTSTQVAEVEALAEAGRFLEIHARATMLPPWESWREPRAAFVASVVTHYLGAPTLASRWVIRSFRRHPRHREAFASYLVELAARRGALLAWARLRAAPDLVGDEHATAHLLRARIRIHGQLQDYAEALRLADELEALTGVDARSFEERAMILERGDRPEEALRLHERLAPAIRDHFRTRRALARLHLMLGDFASAEVALGADSSGDLDELRAAVAIARGDYDAAERELAAEERALPLADEPTRRSLVARRYDLACRRGRIDEAILHAEALGATAEVERLRRRAPTARRHSLVVPYVRQDLLTCAPATLTSLSTFFGRSAAHDEIAAAICYDGTPHHAQWRWAEANGFVVRSFRADAETAKRLLDAGIPFALSSAEATAAHVRVVVGYDDNRGSFVFRESATPIEVEVDAEAFLARHRGTGPRAMVIVPSDDAERLATLERIVLPEADAFSRLHAIELALDENRRDDAAVEVARMAAEAPDAVTTLLARRGLAHYDDDEASLAAVADSALRVFPESDFWRALAVRCVPTTLDHRARVAQLEALARPDDHDPHFRERLAVERGRDARYAAEARTVLRRSASIFGGRAWPLLDLARLEQRLGDRREAAELLRLAACAAPIDEEIGFAAANALHSTGERERAAQFLDERIARIAHDAPRLTKARFLVEVGRRDEALAVLDEVAGRATKPDVLVAAVGAYSRCGAHDHATRLAAPIAPSLAPIVRHRMEAGLAEARGDPAEALAHHRAVLLLAPRDPVAHGALSGAASVQGPQAALRYLDEVCARFPDSRHLRSLRVRATHGLAPAERLDSLRSHLEHEPNDGWVLRELVLVHVALGDLEEATRFMERARAAEPTSPWTEATHSVLLAAQGRSGEALAASEHAIELAPDDPSLIWNLAAQIDERDAARGALTRVAEHIAERSLACETLDAFERVAWPQFEESELRAILERVRQARSEEWAPIVVLARHLARSGSRAEASAELARARERFPREPAIFDAIADVAERFGEDAEESAAVEAALAIEPTTPRLLRAARLRAARGDEAGADRAREDAFRRDPIHPQLVAWSASVAAARGEIEEAVAKLERFLVGAPGSDEVKAALSTITAEANQPHLALEVMRRVAAAAAWNPDAFVALSDEEWRAGDKAAAILTLEAGVARFPRHIGLTDTLASALVFAGSPERALEVCAAAPPDYRIRGRMAWVHAKRGDVAHATRLLEPLVREHPSWAWGARELAALHEAAGDVDKHLRARRRVVELVPDAPLVYGMLSNAATDAGELDEAIRALERMTKLTPTDSLVTDVLVRRLLAAGKPSDAVRVIAAARSPVTEGRRRLGVLAKAHAGDRAGMLADLRAIWADDSASSWLVFEARRAALEGGDPDAVIALTEAMFRERARPELAKSFYAHARAEERSPAAILGEASGAAYAELAACWIAELAETKQVNTLLWFVVRNLRRFHADPVVWPAVARAWFRIGWYYPFVWWMRGWQHRERKARIAQSMLDLVLVCMTQGDYAQARAASTSAIEDPDGFGMDHRALLGLLDAADGDFAAARSRIDEIGAQELGPLYAKVVGAVRALCDGPVDELDAAIVSLREPSAWAQGLAERARVAALRRRGASSIRIALAEVRPGAIVGVGLLLTAFAVAVSAVVLPDQVADAVLVAVLLWASIMVVAIRTSRPA
jgi:tetratricopeptide (TPR) repeat protein